MKTLTLLIVVGTLAYADVLPTAPIAAATTNQQHSPQTEGAIQGPIKKIYSIRQSYRGPDSDFVVVLTWNSTDGIGDYAPAQQTSLEGFDCKNYVRDAKKTLIIFDGYGSPTKIICK